MKIRFVLVVLLQLALMTPWSLNAQDMNDNFFYIEEESYRAPGDPEVNTQGIWGNMTVTDYEDGTVLPLGSGLWVLAATAGLYLLIRTRKSRKAATMMAAALALTLGMTQCRKPNIDVVTPTSGDEILVSLTVASGAKTDINVDNGHVTWNNGDKVYVVCQGKIMGGYLTVPSSGEGQVLSNISGTVTVPAGVDLTVTPLQFKFYYVGSGFSFNPAIGATSISFNLSGQTASGQDAGSFQVGQTDLVDMIYNSGTSQYEVDGGERVPFNSMTSVIRVNTNNIETAGNIVKMRGVNNMMSINLSTLTPASSKDGNGEISFLANADAKVSVFPSAKTSSYNYTLATLIGNTSCLAANLKITNGIEGGKVYAKIIDNVPYPIGLKKYGEFSVSSTNKVYFSQGNLQYIASGFSIHGEESQTSPYFRFATEQYDRLGNGPTGTPSGNVTITGAVGYNNSTNTTACRDLFGYGTSGYGSYKPYMTSISYSDYPNADLDSNTDWGKFNPIYNGGETTGKWRTLTNDEWDYVIHTRGGNRFAHSTVHGINGLILFPDNYSIPSGITLSSINTDIVSSINSVSDANWSVLENDGCVFLPACYYRNGSTVSADSKYYNGNYWTATRNSDSYSYYTYLLWWSHDGYKVKTGAIDVTRHFGFAVRLVKDIE